MTFNIAAASPAEVIAEAARRTQRAKQGLSLNDDAPATSAPPGVGPRRSEKEEELRCDQIVAHAGGQSVHFSVRRASEQTPGIPDRRYRLNGLAFWWEVKKWDGRLTEEQDEFLTAEYRCGALIGAGTSEDLSLIVATLERHELPRARELLHASFARVLGRGYRRGEKLNRASE